MCLVHVFHGLLKYTLNSYLIFYNSLMAAYIPTVKGRKTMGLCFRPKPAREQQVLVLKTTLSDVLPGCENLCTHSKVYSSNEKANETTKGNFKCGEHSLNLLK